MARESIGETHSVVRLKLNEHDVTFVAVSYQIEFGVFDTPSTWAISFGVPARMVAGALAVTAPRTSYDLYIDNALQMSGHIDDRSVSGDANATSFGIKGRDRLSELFDRFTTSEKTYNNTTIVDLAETLMDEVYERDGYELVYSADTARIQITGNDSKPSGLSGGGGGAVKIALPTLKDTSGGPETLDQMVEDANAKKPKASKTNRVIFTHQLTDPDAQTLVVPKRALNEFNNFKFKSVKEFEAGIKFLRAEAKRLKGSGGGGGDGPPPKPVVTAKLGDRYFDGILKPELDRAGLFLWQMARQFILSVPNVAQTPRTKIVRTLSGRESSPVLSFAFDDRTLGRHSSVTVHAKSGAGAKARSFKDGTAVDGEMLSYGWLRPHAVEDSKCKSDKQAEEFAKRKIAESRRKGWTLSYTLSGHTTVNDAGKRVVWAPDTTVSVVDEILGITGTFYIERVRHEGGPDGRTTTVTLMRPADALFGDGSNA